MTNRFRRLLQEPLRAAFSIQKRSIRLCQDHSTASTLFQEPLALNRSRLLVGKFLNSNMEENQLENSKKLAAYRAVNDHIKDNQVVGIGSGTTVVYAVQRIAERVKEENLKLVCIPTSFQARDLIIQHQLSLSDLDSNPKIDVTIDGCDECDVGLNLIKGGGGCHLQEKIVASASEKLIIVADERKNSTYLGQNWKKGIPLEISQIGWRVVLNKLNDFGKTEAVVVKTTDVHAQLRLASKKMGPVVTDSGNFIIDFYTHRLFDNQTSPYFSPETLDSYLKSIPGILETGLFIGMAKEAYFGNQDGTVTTRTCPSYS